MGFSDVAFDRNLAFALTYQYGWLVSPPYAREQGCIHSWINLTISIMTLPMVCISMLPGDGLLPLGGYLLLLRGSGACSHSAWLVPSQFRLSLLKYNSCKGGWSLLRFFWQLGFCRRFTNSGRAFQNGKL